MSAATGAEPDLEVPLLADLKQFSSCYMFGGTVPLGYGMKCMHMQACLLWITSPLFGLAICLQHTIISVHNEHDFVLTAVILC